MMMSNLRQHLRQQREDRPSHPASPAAVSQRPADMRSLQDALDHTRATRWRGLRSAATNYSQGANAIATLQVGHQYELKVGEVSEAMLVEAVTKWQTRGFSPSTINKRLAILSALGVEAVTGCYVRQPKVLKWWLRPSDQVKLCAWLREEDQGASTTTNIILADFIEWTTRTGLRVEESLRLTRAHIEFNEGNGTASITVPGTKTAIAQKHLPIGEEARRILIARGMALDSCPPNARLFPIHYATLRKAWSKLCAERLGDSVPPGATLKALRRSAARHLTTKGMPLDVLRQYLRHENIQTTMGYLRLTGGYAEEETRRWL
jgi:integrase